MKYAELIQNACLCIKQFNPVYLTVDSHADDFIEKNVTLNFFDFAISD
jgi:hypothetical protein